MVIYLSSHNYSQILNEAIHICNKNIQKAIIETEISLAGFMDEQKDQFQFADELIIDLTCITDSRYEICLALNSFRQEHNSIRIIVISPGREKDRLLSDMVSLGIYDIAISEGEELLKDLCHCIKDGMTYKDCAQFKMASVENQLNTPLAHAKVKERIVIKSEVIQTVNKALIGFVGTQDRIGVTHHAILSACILKNNGFKIAVVENNKNKNPVLASVKENFEIAPKDITENYFSLNMIDFYPSFNLTGLYKVLAKNYNFIIIDFGLFDPEYLAELNRCIVPVVVCGSKPWEVDQINKVFESASEEILKEFYYLFNYTDLTKAELLIRSMGELGKVYIADMTPDPFNTLDAPTLRMIFKKFLLPEKDEKKRSFAKWAKTILERKVI